VLLMLTSILVTAVSGCARTPSGEVDEPTPPAHAAAQEHAQRADTAESADEPRPVALDAAEQARLGIVAQKLKAVPAPSGRQSTARVLDPGPLLALDSELAAAEASLSASRAEAERTQKLFAEDRTASAHALETANSQAQADGQRVASLQRRISLEWGEGIASRPRARRTALLNDLAQVRAELIRIELPPGVPAPHSGSTVSVRLNADAPELQAIVLGTLPTADPRLQTRGLLVELRGADASLAIGSMLLARIPEQTAAAGVLLPRSALIRKDSRVWAYVQTAPTTFMRREVSDYQPGADGWFVARGFMTGDCVVTAGAASLFAIEEPAAAAD
jgi:hypothetical protein